MTFLNFDSQSNKIKIYLILILLPTCLYIKSVLYDFSPMDDQWMIVSNGGIFSDSKNILDFFLKPLAGIYYRPLFSISLLFNYWIGKVNPTIYHFSNLILYILSIILIFKTLLALHVQQKIAFAISIIFSVHPLLLHAVAWIPGGNDILLSIFSLSSIIFLINFLNDKRSIHFILHLLFFICALLTKENAVSLILVYFVLLYYFSLSKTKFFNLYIAWSFIILIWYFIRNLIVQQAITINGKGSMIALNFVKGLLLYLGKTILPIQQSIFPTLQNSNAIIGLIVLIVISICILKYGIKNKGIVLFGLVLFLSVLSIPLFFGSMSSYGEHYEQRAYLPLLGILLLISQIKLNIKSIYQNYIVVFIIICFSIKTFYRMDIYKNQHTFIEAGLVEAPDYYFFYAAKADWLLQEKNYSNAALYYSKAIQKEPKRSQLYQSRAYIYFELNEKDKAIADYTNAINYSNGNPEIYLARCLAYTKFRNVKMAMLDFDYIKQRAPKLMTPDFEKQLYNEWCDIVEYDLTQKIILDPKNTTLYIQKAKNLAARNKIGEALENVKIACDLEPENLDFKNYFLELSTIKKQ